jgi:hypothetical protein
MSQKLEKQIRERAYHLWLADGCREGEADRHWLAAERELLAMSVHLPQASEKRPPHAEIARQALAADPATYASKPRRRRAS